MARQPKAELTEAQIERAVTYLRQSVASAFKDDPTPSTLRQIVIDLQAAIGAAK